MVNSDLNNSNEVNGKHYKIHLTCSPATAKMINKDCIREFVKHHPDFEEMKISQGFILKKIAEHYLSSP